MSSPNWARAFGISDEDLAALENQLTGHDHPLRWMLLNGHIASDAYIRWARDEFGLPSVKDSYFDVPADLVLWEAVKSEFNWSPSFFPLAIWDGVTLIGCLQPPDFHFPMRTPHQFVIASANALERRFLELEPQTKTGFKIPVEDAPAVATEPAPVEVAAAPMEDIDREAVTEYAAPIEEEIPPSHAPSEPEHEVEGEIEFESVQTAHVRQRPADEILADSLPAAPEVDMRDPEGFMMDVDSNSSIDLFAQPEGLQHQELAPLPTTPDGFEATSQVVQMNELDFSMPSAPVPADPDEITQPIAEAPKPAAAPAMKVVEPPRAPVVPPGPPAAAASSVAAKSEKVIMPPTPPAAPTTLRSNVSSSEPAVPLATCTSIDSLMAAAVAHINVHFEHAMVMNYENAVLRPARWSELLLSIKGDSPDPISLEQASIFRIAARTSLPYHGYVVSNPTNMSFYNAFNRGILPKHTTVMPVMIAGQLTAMLVGLANEAVDYKGSLVAMEKLASDFSTQLERLREKKQAA